MNYPESKLILEEIKKAKKILINCHKGPDPDSVGSALATYEVLKVYFQKDVTVICPDDLPSTTLFLEKRLTESLVFEKVDFDKFNLSKYDLLIALDSSSWDMVRGGGNNQELNIRTVVVDHHPTNKRYGTINLVDEVISSTAELLYFIFNDWGIDPDIEFGYPYFQKSLLTGILSDTGCLKYTNVDAKTMSVVADLMRFVDKNEVIFNLYQNNSISSLQVTGELLSKITLDKEHKFVYSVLSYSEYKKYSSEDEAKDIVSGNFIQSVENTDFGFVAVEEKPRELSISFRSRTDFDSSKIAVELGGGGHIVASGAKIRDTFFNEAVEKVLEVCRRYAKKDS
ncbi:MAG: bifunctional oligoribonuclease/PAP phosphatase NrnA [Patescibacteria group bacterium]